MTIIGREVDVANRILVAPREGGRRCPSQTPAASGERGTLDKQPNVSIQSWAPNLARECGQDSVTIGCNAVFGEAPPVSCRQDQVSDSTAC